MSNHFSIYYLSLICPLYYHTFLFAYDVNVFILSMATIWFTMLTVIVQSRALLAVQCVFQVRCTHYPLKNYYFKVFIKTNQNIFLPGEMDYEVIVCGEPGQCMDEAVGLIKAPSVDDCIMFCNTDPRCNFWTFNTDVYLCLAFPECKEVDEDSCPSCIYGERECPTTGMQQPYTSKETSKININIGNMSLES